MPGVPAADLALVQADLTLGGLERFLDGPADPGHSDTLGESGQQRWKASSPVVVQGYCVVGLLLVTAPIR